MDEDVVHVDCNIAFVDEFTEKMIHHRLESCGCIREAKEHDHWFEEAAIRLECGLPLIAISHTDVVVPLTDIQLRKERRPVAVYPCESIHELSDEQEWGGIANGECVQSAVVLNGSKIAILLLDEEEWECVGGL